MNGNGQRWIQKRWIQTSLALLVFLLGMLLIGPLPMARANANESLVDNGSFEQLLGGFPLHWRLRDALSADAEMSRSGGVALKITDSGAGYSYQSLTLQPNTAYVLSAWVRTGNMTGTVGVRYAQLAPAGEVWWTGVTHATNEWTPIQVEFRTPAGYQSGRLDVFWTLGEGNVAWVDDVQLVAKNAQGVNAPILGYRQAQLEEFVRVDLQAEPGTDIRYTTDGTEPTSTSLLYTGPLPIKEGRSVQARTFGGSASSQTVCLNTGMKSMAEMPASDQYFPLGVFEDASRIGGVNGFREMLFDLQAHGLDSVYMTNNFIAQDVDLLDISDCLGTNIFMTPAGELNEFWWPGTVPATAAAADAIAATFTSLAAGHPSLRGYGVADEPGLHQQEKVALLTSALHQHDPNRIAMPVLIGIDRVGPIFTAAQPDVLLIDVYPTGWHNPIGDFSMTGFGYASLDFVGYIRRATQDKPAGTPLWLILQTHSFGSGGPFSLRTPVTAEVRAQQWLAVGEGATGIFWFVYSTQQSWTGLVDNPPLYTEVSRLAGRLRPLRALLLAAHKDVDRFSARYPDGGETQPYASTLVSDGGTTHYALVVNMDMQQARPIELSSDQFRGHLRNLETGEVAALGSAVLVEPGDGQIFELVHAARITTAAPRISVENTVSTTELANVDSLMRVSMVSDTSAAQIHYTIDGSYPSIEAKRFSAPFLVPNDAIIQARAYVTDHNPSEVSWFATAHTVPVETIANTLYLPGIQPAYAPSEEVD